MKAIGIVGVGYIGSLFLDKLLDAGYDVSVVDVDDEQVRAATKRGASHADTPAELARTTDAVVMALPGSPEVEATMEGEDGLLAGLEAGQVLVDATTTLPETSVACERLCRDRDVQFVEAPITGGSPRPGYHVMVGGTETAYGAAREILDAICDDHVRIGDVGDATVFKLALQLRYAGQQAVDAEVVEFCRDNGVDPSPLNEFLELGVWDRYFTGEYEQAIQGLGGLAIWHKDVGYARQVARENGTALPLAAVVHEAYKATVRRVDENEGHAAALIEYWRALNDAEDRDAR
ncbi:NAD(P)-binding domain-containing protein [Halobacteria archaeon HArc-gm2]|nr:NAD(P)-binding domain-containing protein [Halobacteria archaeon HArc-gm2]